MQPTTLRVDPSAPIGRISPRLYGHFAEHLGRCCYDGLRVDPNRPDIPSENGFRSDVLAALKEMAVPLLRWPGGCYADHYHWRDGVGTPESRTRSLGMSCGLQVIEDNSLGTHEFIWLCEYLGAEPYLAGNVGSGTVQELCDWVEYCNTPLPTTMGNLRTKNGAPDPFGVKLWGVGNENWGCGGNMTPEGYANEYRKYATMLRHVDPGAELVVCGHTDGWNQALVASLGDKMSLVDHFSIHSYWIEGGPETDFTVDEYYHLFDEVERTEEFVKRTAALVANATGGKHTIGIALDEWGIWHPEAREWGPGANSRLPQTYEQAGTLRDALAVGVMLEGFHRQCNVMTLANLAQIVNVLHAPVMTEGDKLWVTPTWHALRMHKPHIGATALTVAVEDAPQANNKNAVSATASKSERGIAVTIVNRHYEDAARVVIEGIEGYSNASAELLSGESAASVNSVVNPKAVSTAAVILKAEGGAWHIELPAHSMATVVFSKQESS